MYIAAVYVYQINEFLWGWRDGVKQSCFVEGDSDWRQWLPDLTPPPQLHVKNPVSFVGWKLR